MSASSPTTGFRRRVRRADGVGVAGLVLVIAGSFLPWLASGPVLRNSYQVTGLAARLAIGGGGPFTVVLQQWPLFGPVFVLPVVLRVLGAWRTGGIIAGILGGLGLALGVGVLVVGAGRSAGGVSLVTAGPLTLATGGLLYAAAGGLLVAVGRQRRQVRRSQQQFAPNQDTMGSSGTSAHPGASNP